MSKRAKTRRAWPDHLRSRLSALRRRMRRERLDAMLLTNPLDIRYLSGFRGDDSWMLVFARIAVVISDSRFEEELATTCAYLPTVMRHGALSVALESVVEDRAARRVGFQADHLTVQEHGDLVKRLGKRRLKPTVRWVLDQRTAKDSAEVRHIRRAIRIQQEAYQQVLRELKTGTTERAVAARLDQLMCELGTEGPSFDTIVAFDANGSLPHAVPGDARLRRNSVLLFDFGAKADGYCSDLTRVVARGRMPRRIREIYPIVRDAQLAAIAAIKPGARLKDVDAAARDIIADAGFAARFGHSTGHGIGLDIHEQPSLSPRSKGRLEPGHVVTVEPGIYLPGVGGVRIEDDILVTDTGRRKLSSLPSDLDSAII